MRMSPLPADRCGARDQRAQAARHDRAPSGARLDQPWFNAKIAETEQSRRAIRCTRSRATAGAAGMADRAARPRHRLLAVVWRVGMEEGAQAGNSPPLSIQLGKALGGAASARRGTEPSAASRRSTRLRCCFYARLRGGQAADQVGRRSHAAGCPMHAHLHHHHHPCHREAWAKLPAWRAAPAARAGGQRKSDSGSGLCGRARRHTDDGSRRTGRGSLAVELFLSEALKVW